MFWRWQLPTPSSFGAANDAAMSCDILSQIIFVSVAQLFVVSAQQNRSYRSLSISSNRWWQSPPCFVPIESLQNLSATNGNDLPSSERQLKIVGGHCHPSQVCSGLPHLRLWMSELQVCLCRVGSRSCLTRTRWCHRRSVAACCSQIRFDLRLAVDDVKLRVLKIWL